jgi:cell division protein FtsZ
MIELESLGVEELRPRICVIGVGGAGGNAVANMLAGDVIGVDFLVANTDAQALNASAAGGRIQLGRSLTQGLGAGSVAEIGRAAAEESVDEIRLALEGAHICFIAAGMGGGTGTGAAPVVARIAGEMGILTIGVVTRPFAFEGSRRTRVAEAGIAELERFVDTLIVIPNQNLFRTAGPATTIRDAFRSADDVLRQGVRGITDLIVTPGLVNLDFADIRAVMSGMGRAMMGTGEASGANRAVEAAKLAISNPLLDGAVNGARGVVISITGGEDLRLTEMDEAAGYIMDLIDPEADIIWGSAVDPGMNGQMRVSIVATGLASDPAGGLAAPAIHPVAQALPISTSPAFAEAATADAPRFAAILAASFDPAAMALNGWAETGVDDLPLFPLIPPEPLSAAPRPAPSLFERVSSLARTAARAELELALEAPGAAPPHPQERRAGFFR